MGLVAAALIGAMSLTACGDDSNDGGGGNSSAPKSDLKVGMAYDIGGRGDKSFNDSANAGLQQAIADGLVCEENAIINEANSTGSDRDQNVQALADAGMNIVIGVGFPIVSVRIPIMLWKYAVVRSPPFHQVE